MANSKRLKKMKNVAYPLVKKRKEVERRLAGKGKESLIKTKLPEEVIRAAEKSKKISEEKLEKVKKEKYIVDVIVSGSVASKTAAKESDIDLQRGKTWLVGRGPFLPYVVLKGNKAKIEKEMGEARKRNVLECIRAVELYEKKPATVHTIKEHLLSTWGRETKRDAEKKKRYSFLMHNPILETLKTLEKEGKIKKSRKTKKGQSYVLK